MFDSWDRGWQLNNRNGAITDLYQTELAAQQNQGNTNELADQQPLRKDSTAFKQLCRSKNKQFLKELLRNSK